MRKNARLIMILSFVLFLVSCAINPVPFRGPNGNQAYSMRCPPAVGGLDGCYQKAGELCPDGYWIVGQSAKLSGVVVMPVGSGFMGVPIRHNTLAIECK